MHFALYKRVTTQFLSIFIKIGRKKGKGKDEEDFNSSTIFSFSTVIMLHGHRMWR